jgi:hypothetical protein
MIMKISISLIACLIFLAGCEKSVDLDLSQTEPRVVIEGLLTDHSSLNYVKVTKSAGFYETGKTPRITDAIVMIEDDLGEVTAFVHNPRNHPDSAGFYKASDSFSGVIGRTYKLSVEADGKHFEAQDKMFPVTTIDSLTYRIEFKDPETPGKFYEVLIYAKEPQETKDYYLFNFYRNGTIVLDNPSDIYFSDDVALGEQIDGITAPGFYGIGDVVKVEALSLTRNGYIFYSDLSNLLNNFGGMFSAPPANCRNNLTNGALGFFQVSAVNSAEVVIEE